MTRSGFLNEREELLKVDFSKGRVVRIFSHFTHANKARQKQNIDQLKSFDAKFDHLKDMK